MATAEVVEIALPPPPGDWAGERGFKQVGKPSEPTQRTIEPVGPHFLAHARRSRHGRTFSEDDRIQAHERAKKVEDEEDSGIDEPEDPSMLLRDPKDWKTQDHYAVLGISALRYRATEEQIKKAHRKKVLLHHPDKKAAAGKADDDGFFKCIQKATEILLDPAKRRQFDSVDTEADVDPPSRKQAQQKGNNYYKLWDAVFRSEARFSKTEPVPGLGDEKSTKEEVDDFYNFWYNFDSWRSFEYLDEDVPDDNEGRDQKRHTERKNANARKKKKAEDNARLRRLLEDCQNGDERIRRFRKEANAAKNKRRLDREAAEQAAKEEAQRKKEEEERRRAEAEARAKADREVAKKARDAAKNAVKKNKRVLRASVKEVDFPGSASPDAVLADVDLVISRCEPEDIADLAHRLAGPPPADQVRAVWRARIEKLVQADKMREGEAGVLLA